MIRQEINLNSITPPDDGPPSLGGDLNRQIRDHTAAELALVSLCTLTSQRYNSLYNPSLAF